MTTDRAALPGTNAKDSFLITDIELDRFCRWMIRQIRRRQLNLEAIEQKRFEAAARRRQRAADRKAAAA